jgi:hypothetical protein
VRHETGDARHDFLFARHETPIASHEALSRVTFSCVRVTIVDSRVTLVWLCVTFFHSRVTIAHECVTIPWLRVTKACVAGGGLLGNGAEANVATSKFNDVPPDVIAPRDAVGSSWPIRSIPPAAEPMSMNMLRKCPPMTAALQADAEASVQPNLPSEPTGGSTLDVNLSALAA